MAPKRVEAATTAANTNGATPFSPRRVKPEAADEALALATALPLDAVAVALPEPADAVPTL